MCSIYIYNGFECCFPRWVAMFALLGWHAMPTSTYDSIYARNFQKKREVRLNRRAESKAKSCGTCVEAGAEMSTIFSPSHFPIIFANFRSNDRRWTSFIFGERRGIEQEKAKGSMANQFSRKPFDHSTVWWFRVGTAPDVLRKLMDRPVPSHTIRISRPARFPVSTFDFQQNRRKARITRHYWAMWNVAKSAQCLSLYQIWNKGNTQKALCQTMRSNPFPIGYYESTNNCPKSARSSESQNWLLVKSDVLPYRLFGW